MSEKNVKKLAQKVRKQCSKCYSDLYNDAETGVLFCSHCGYPEKDCRSSQRFW